MLAFTHIAPLHYSMRKNSSWIFPHSQSVSQTILPIHSVWHFDIYPHTTYVHNDNEMRLFGVKCSIWAPLPLGSFRIAAFAVASLSCLSPRTFSLCFLLFQERSFSLVNKTREKKRPSRMALRIRSIGILLLFSVVNRARLNHSKPSTRFFFFFVFW